MEQRGAAGQSIPQDEIARILAASGGAREATQPQHERTTGRKGSLRRGFMRLMHEVVEETIEEVLDPF